MSVLLQMIQTRPAQDYTMSMRRDVGNTAKFGVFVSKKCLDVKEKPKDDGLRTHSVHIPSPYFSAHMDCF